MQIDIQARDFSLTDALRRQGRTPIPGSSRSGMQQD